MDFYPFRIVVFVVLALLAGVLLLQGPLKSWVPDCKDISFGFCYRR